MALVGRQGGLCHASYIRAACTPSAVPREALWDDVTLACDVTAIGKGLLLDSLHPWLTSLVSVLKKTDSRLEDEVEQKRMIMKREREREEDGGKEENENGKGRRKI